MFFVLTTSEFLVFTRNRSYPNFGGKCRKLAYPDIDLFYHACDVANVECVHVYLYRDPYSVVSSTTIKRHINVKGIPQATRLYTSMLNIIYAQLSLHSSRTAGCFGFFDGNSTSTELWDPLQDMFGEEDPAGFNNRIKEVYMPPSLMTDKEKRAMFPKQYDLPMESMIRAHENVLKLCREQIGSKKLFLPYT
jgi:hypothetical protein